MSHVGFSMDSVPKTLDWDLEHKKDRWLKPDFTTENVFEACRSTLCKLINREKYTEAIELYNQIVNTGIYDISGCWKTGLMLAKKTGNDPVAYLEAAHRVCRNKHKANIFLAYISALMEAGRVDVVEENVNTIWVSVHGKNSDVQDIQALLQGVKSNENWVNYLKNRCEHIPRKSQYTPSWIPTDEAVVIEYLNMLRFRDYDAFVQAATTVLQRAGQGSDLDLMRLALKYHTPPFQPFDKWLELMTPYNQLDPAADPSIFAEPFLEACFAQFEYWDPRKPETFTEYCYVYDLFKDRLKATKYDQWAIDKLSWLCAVILNMKKFRYQFAYAQFLNADQLGRIVESKLADMVQEEHAALEEIKEAGKVNDKKMMQAVGSFQLKIAAFERLYALLDSVHCIISD